MSETVSASYKEGSQFWSSYLPLCYSEIDDYHKFTLKHLDQFFKTYEPPAAAGGAKLLEFGGGAVVINLISAAPKCKEITFTDFREDNREWMKRWLKKDSMAFNWQPFFSYVVCTLEGGTEKDIEERKELVRSAVKAVVPCDILQPVPVEDKGPYDIVSSFLCLEYVSMTGKEYSEGVAKLAQLVKPGGTLLMLVDENVQSWIPDGNEFKTHPISREFLRESLELAGFKHITMDFLPREAMPAGVWETLPSIKSAMFTVATK